MNPATLTRPLKCPPLTNRFQLRSTLRESKIPIYRGTFTPRRKWQVYALPMEQADFGYNDLPARTLEWENRFIDKTLEIQQKYPSYSFTLDAAANLESYLSTRKNEKAKQLLGHLRDRKMGHERAVRELFHRPFDTGRTVPHARLLSGSRATNTISRSIPHRRPMSRP